ncbi:MAG: DMT family transporter [Alphaproteobacteria bacterium]|nr:DMT family transporter [Alphaproteobacteria bacterium]
MVLFTTASAMIRLTEGCYPIFQIVFLRNLLALLPFSLLIIMRRLSLHTAHFPTHLWRGVLGSFSHICLFSSILLLPFADANVLSYAATFVVCLLSVIFLKESLSLKGWLALLIGFLGVAIISNPSGSLTGLGVTFALTSAFIEGLVIVHNRYFSIRENPFRMLFYYAFVASITMLFVMIAVPFFNHDGWVPLTLMDGIYLSAFGILGGMGQACITIACTKAQTSTLAPLIYTGVLWSSLYGSLIFHESLGYSLCIGAVLIIASGLYIIIGTKK